MATTEEHCRDCLRELAERFEFVHEWLDELQPEYGPMHRPFRHHTEGVERVRAKWGDRAARAAEIHIRRDTGGMIPTPEELRHNWGITPEDITPPESDD
jgi:hypothetical protein